MEKSKEEKEMETLSWPTLLLVTGASFFLFSFILKLIDGQHKSFFLYAGAISLLCGVLAWLGRRPGN